MTDEPKPADVCCGEKRSGERRPDMAGQPLIPACQLCPKSATYWRKGEDDDT